MRAAAKNITLAERVSGRGIAEEFGAILEVL
jgi:hypothetical protein